MSRSQITFEVQRAQCQCVGKKAQQTALSGSTLSLRYPSDNLACEMGGANCRKELCAEILQARTSVPYNDSFLSNSFQFIDH
jgi:hypothetical protein